MVPGLQIDPAFILLGVKESTTVTSQIICRPDAQGTSVTPSGLSPSVLNMFEGSNMEGIFFGTKGLLEKSIQICMYREPSGTFSAT